MKMNRAKRGTIVLNKLYGGFYVVDSNCKDENGKIVSAQVLRIKVDDYLESLNIRFTSDNKRELFLREIEIDHILAIFPRKILLGVKAGEDKISLMYFDPNYEGKEFRPALKGITIPVPQKVTLANDNLLLYYSRTHMEEKGEGDEKTTEEVVDASGYVIYDSEGSLLDHEEYDTDPDEDHEIDTPLGKYVISTDNLIVFQGEFNGKPFTNIYSREYNKLRSIELASKVSSAEENVDGFMLIKTADELAVVSDSGNELVLKPSKQLSKALDQLYGYDILVDYCNKGRYFILTFASSSYEVKTLKGTFTSDIGLVLTVE